MSRIGLPPLARALAVALPAGWLLAALLSRVVLADLAWVSASLRVFAQAAALLCSALLLRPALPAGGAGGVAWAGAVAVAALAWMPSAAGVALGVLLVLLGAAALDAALARALSDAAARQRCALAVFALAGTTPLWGGPFAEQLEGGAAALVLGVSPLSLLAVLAGHDYLRDPWFYSHSALGTLRVDYPGAGPLVAAYLGASALLLAASRFPIPLHSRSIHA